MVVVRASSAMPWASLAMQWTVAGATRMRSALWANGNVLHGQLRLGVEHVGDDRPVGQTPKCQGRDEVGRALAQDDVNVSALLRELAGEVGGLVAGDATRDSQDYVTVSKRVIHASPPYLRPWR